MNRQRKWLKKYCNAIHRHDQCQALADEMNAEGNPKEASIRKLQKMYDFLSKVASDKLKSIQRK